MNDERQRLIGTWTLVEWFNQTNDGEKLYPLGSDATGYVSYTHDGFVLVQVCALGRKPYAVNDPFTGSAEEDQAAIKSQIAYSGRFTVEDDTVIHHVTHATCPNWVGTEQRRKLHFDGNDRLTLKAENAGFQGQKVTATVHWSRAKPTPL